MLRRTAEAAAMKPYLVIVHKDENSAYGMTFPDAPGCFSAADEMDDLFAMASEALELWAEGMREDGLPIPEPRDLEALKAAPEWADDFNQAVKLIAIHMYSRLERDIII
jgi:predicted RNase H-like HicB family nuclease